MLYTATYLEKEAVQLEKVQRRATRIIPFLRNYEYDKRLELLELTDLKLRRMRGDLIQIYKIINGYESIKLINGIDFSPN